MKKSININSTEWCDIVFQNKNKEYGAYTLRQSSGKHHILAFGIIVTFMILVSVLPSLINTVKAHNAGRSENLNNVVTIAQIDRSQDIIDAIQRDVAPPPPVIRPSIQFVPPVIASDDEVTDDNQMNTQDAILDDPRMISIGTVEGIDLDTGVDIATIRQNDQIIEKPKEPEKPFDIVEQMPQFPGGETEMRRFIANTLIYPVSAQEIGIHGRVTLRFVVTAQGDISDIQVLRGIDPACDKEAVRVIKAMPKWIPGMQNGIKVPVYFILPIVYQLN